MADTSDRLLAGVPLRGRLRQALDLFTAGVEKHEIPVDFFTDNRHDAVPAGFSGLVESMGRYVGMIGSGERVGRLTTRSLSALVYTNALTLRRVVPNCMTRDNIAVTCHVTVTLRIVAPHEFHYMGNGPAIIPAWMEERMQTLVRKTPVESVFDTVKTEAARITENDTSALSKYGIKVTAIAVTEIVLPEDIRRHLEDAATQRVRQLEEVAGARLKLQEAQARAMAEGKAEAEAKIEVNEGESGTAGGLLLCTHSMLSPSEVAAATVSPSSNDHTHPHPAFGFAAGSTATDSIAIETVAGPDRSSAVIQVVNADGTPALALGRLVGDRLAPLVLTVPEMDVLAGVLDGGEHSQVREMLRRLGRGALGTFET